MDKHTHMGTPRMVTVACFLVFKVRITSLNQKSGEEFPDLSSGEPREREPGKGKVSEWLSR